MYIYCIYFPVLQEHFGGGRVVVPAVNSLLAWPVIERVYPAVAPITEGTKATVRGRHLGPGATIRVGSLHAPIITQAHSRSSLAYAHFFFSLCPILTHVRSGWRQRYVFGTRISESRLCQDGTGEWGWWVRYPGGGHILLRTVRTRRPKV